MAQASITGEPLVEIITPYVWLALPLAVAVWLGHRIHLKISEHTYRTGMLVLILVAGVIYLLR